MTLKVHLELVKNPTIAQLGSKTIERKNASSPGFVEMGAIRRAGAAQGRPKGGAFLLYCT